MSASRPQFSIDDAFELSLEDTGPGLEPSGVARFGPLHFERRARFEVADEDKQSRLRYQNLENDEDGAQASPEPDGGVSSRDSGQTSIRSSQWSFSSISSSTQRSYNACCRPKPRGRSRVEVPTLPPASASCGASLTLAAPFVCSADPDRRGTGGGPLARCLQRHLLRAGLPVAGPRSLPRDLHLLRRQGSPGASSSSTCPTSRSEQLEVDGGIQRQRREAPVCAASSHP
uniref:Transmembrane protein 134 n=1 Tax=Bos taurus TaxID=9913 RepID=A0AAA9TBZ1_BOVIN